MQEGFQFSGYFNGKSGIPQKTVTLTFVISFACHAVLIGVLFFLPGYSRPMFNPFPSAINVSLVSLPAGRPGPPAGKPALKKSAAIVEKKVVKQVPAKIEKPKEISKPEIKAVKKAQEKPVTKVSKAISLKPKISPKKKVESAELIKNAVKDMEKKVEESRPSSVDEAISKIRDKIAKAEGANQSRGLGSQGSAIKGAVPGISGGSGGSNLPIGIFDIYKAEIFYTIQQNWAYSEQIGGRGLDELAVLVIKIMHNGEISDIRFESRSKNRYLDESAYRAIQKSNPLPPLPEGYSRPYYEVGLRFGTSGLKRN
ncbi:MAG: TonB family protein [Proteobacteria bacterium]|nr:TonB family protein [Pseudomonadota bacterium]